MSNNQPTLDQIISLAKRRGFIFPSSTIYGGLSNVYDYGPLGVELLNNLRNHWWQTFVHQREEIYGLETSVLMNPKVWEASGHTSSFTDALIDCKNCQNRTRADHLIENYFEKKGESTKVEGKSVEELTQIIQENQMNCPVCGLSDWTDAREFNLLFETNIGIVSDDQSLTYLRGETAQGMFVNFKNILDTMSPKLPFGLAQSGKAFRNEITLGQSVFRTLEFDLAEFEYYIREDEWEDTYETLKQDIYRFALGLGLDKNRLRWREHTADELSHYSKRTEDLEYQFPFGYKELFAIAYRTDFDLKNHMEQSGQDLRYTDPYTNDKLIPHVIEPTFGLSRCILALVSNAYWQDEENDRTVLKLKPNLAPYQVAVFPLLKNKPKLVEKARAVFKQLQPHFHTTWDERGNIGKRYLYQDEIGTPFCITIDFDTLEDDAVTIRHRDSTKQDRVAVSNLLKTLKKLIQSTE